MSSSIDGKRNFFKSLNGQNSIQQVPGSTQEPTEDKRRFFQSLGPSLSEQERPAESESMFAIPSKDSLYNKLFGKEEPIDVNSEEHLNPVKSKIRDALQFAGLAKVATWPADVLKTLGVAESLQELQDLKDRGFDIDEKKYMEALQQASNMFPTQDLLEQLAEEHLGIPFEPKTAKQKKIRTAAEFLGFFGKPAVKGITQKPPIEPTELSKIGQKYGMRPVAATEISEPVGTTPVVTKGRVKNIKQKISKQTNALVNAVIKKNIPAAEARALGVDLDAAYEGYITTARQRAAADKNAYSLDSVIEGLDKEISRIKAKSRNPSKEAQAQIDKLNELRSSFLEEGNPKKFSQTDIINQFQAHNKDVSSAYKKTAMTGLEEAETKAYAKTNDLLVDFLQKTTGNQVALPFKMSNEIFNQTRNLEKVEHLLEKALKKPSGLKELMRSPNRKYVERAIGEKGSTQLTEIGRYQAEVAHRLDKMVSHRELELSNLTTFRRLVNEGTTILPRIAGYRYTGTDLGNKYIRAQKLFLQKQYKAAEKLAEEIISNLPD